MLGQTRQYRTILDAAIEEFSRLGYKATSMQVIANRAGIPKANVHYYFKNKENLYREVLNHIIEVWNISFDEIQNDEDPAVALDRMIRAKVRLSYTHANASRLFANEIIHGAEHLGDYLKQDVRQWVRDKSRIIQAWIDAGKMDPVDPVHLIFLIWSSTQHYADFETQVLTILNRAEYETEMIDDIADFLSQVILKGCGLQAP
ncbi:MAG: TetR family transcriptional regulator C-terminal domain-containing protein [Proteobacteria bacterium]|nr:TetR family transcriptional regulator C-terminal domain-containing protein [Pseudomonadota bacterium]